MEFEDIVAINLAVALTCIVLGCYLSYARRKRPRMQCRWYEIHLRWDSLTPKEQREHARQDIRIRTHAALSDKQADELLMFEHTRRGVLFGRETEALLAMRQAYDPSMERAAMEEDSK